MNNGTENMRPLLTVYSGQIISAVVKALDIDHEALNSRTARRFFGGQPVNEHNFTQIFLAMGEALVDGGIVPEPPVFRQYDASTSKIIAAAIARVAYRWDNLVGTMLSHSGRTDAPGPAAVGFLRILTVEMALRVFALLRLAELEPDLPETPLWAQENGGGQLLRAMVGQARLTRGQLAEYLEVSETTVDNWLDGIHRPTPEHIAAIAIALADRIDGATAQRLEQDIRRQFAFAQLADLLVQLTGRDQVLELSAALFRFIRLINESINKIEIPPISEVAETYYYTLQYGTTFPQTYILLRYLAELEPNDDWKRDILAAAVPWEVSFQTVGVVNTGTSSAAGLAQDIKDAAPNMTYEGDFEIAARLAARANNIDYDRFARGDPTLMLQVWDDGIATRRALVCDFPANPMAHFHLGSLLGMVGKHLRNRDFINEGVIECKIASGLLPNWDLPLVEPGIILTNYGAYDEALAELELAAALLPQPTPHLQYATGYTLMMLSRHDAALAEFEAVIAARPDYALAYRDAATCAFALGSARQGVHYAKTARRLGEPDAYNAWQRSRQNRKRRKGAPRG